MAMAFCDKEYFEKVGELQQNLHDSEKRRFKLERELSAFDRSDYQGSQIKNAKLCCYLKQICEREKQAKARNLDLLRHMERIELHMKALCLSYSALHQKKGKVSPEPAAGNPSSHLATGRYHPATVFMGRQTAGASPAEAQAARATFVQPSAAEPSRFSPPAERSESGALSHSRLSGKGAAGDSPAGRSASAGDEMADGPHRPPVTLKAAKDEVRPTAEEGVPPGLSSDARGDGGSASRGSSPKFAPVKEHQEAADSESCSLPSSSVEKSVDPTLSSGSELPLSLSEGGDRTGSPEEAKGSDTPTGGSRGSANAPGDSKGAGKSEAGRELRRGETPSPSKASAQTLSLEGFSRLLESIEERLDGRGTNVYGISSVSEQRLSHLISLGDGKAGWSDEDLGACGAAALQQLQRLSRSTPQGCLLPREMVRANREAPPEEGRIRACLSADGARLWERWFKHAVALRDRRVYSAGRIARLFTPSLVERGASYVHEAEALLRVLLEEATGGALSVESDESSSGLPSLLLDGGEIKAARPVHRLDTSAHGKQDGQQSGEEDSREESFVEESIPIRETKAYQLLKQSAAQQRPQSTEEDEDEEDDEDGLDVFPSGVTRGRYVDNAGKDETARTSSSSFQEGPRASAGKGTRATVPAVQSKAFWGESDDSNSDIEAALRPQSRGAPVDDFDHFYD